MKALLSFFTVIPVRGASLHEAAREAYLLPLVGIVTGLPGAVPAVDGLLRATRGGVHARARGGAPRGRPAPRRRRSRRGRRVDGPREVRERRREVLKDTRVGIGGIGALFLVYAPTVAALAALCAASPSPRGASPARRRGRGPVGDGPHARLRRARGCGFLFRSLRTGAFRAAPYPRRHRWRCWRRCHSFADGRPRAARRARRTPCRLLALRISSSDVRRHRRRRRRCHGRGMPRRGARRDSRQ